MISPLAWTTKLFGVVMNVHSHELLPVLPNRPRLLLVAIAVKLPPERSAATIPMSRLPVLPDPTVAKPSKS